MPVTPPPRPNEGFPVGKGGAADVDVSNELSPNLPIGEAELLALESIGILAEAIAARGQHHAIKPAPNRARHRSHDH